MVILQFELKADDIERDINLHMHEYELTIEDSVYLS